jgi:hypothetical protein
MSIGITFTYTTVKIVKTGKMIAQKIIKCQETYPPRKEKN